MTTNERLNRQLIGGKILRDNPNRVINVAPFMFMINGYVVANSIKEFKNFCKDFGFIKSDFVNWPFNFNL